MKIKKRKVTVDLELFGDGKLIEDDGTIRGGVPLPTQTNRLKFDMYREVLNEDGVLSPVMSEVLKRESVKGAFQVNITSDSKGYAALGRFFLAIAELNTKVDPDYHKHLKGVISDDGRTEFHLIVRKDRM